MNTTIVQIKADDVLVDLLKTQTEQKTASKAFLTAGQSYGRLIDLNDELRRSNDDLRQQLALKLALLGRIEDLYRAIQEVTGQEVLPVE